MSVYRGRVWKFGDNISTDLLMPTFSMFGRMPEEEMKNCCMIAERPEFAKEVKPGDIVVGGQNFGCGSSRPAAKNLVGLGVACVMAESFGAIFFRNSINVGLPALGIKGIAEAFRDGDEAEIDPRAGRVKNLRTGQVFQAPALPEGIMRILDAGGLIPLLKAEAKAGTLYDA